MREERNLSKKSESFPEDIAKARIPVSGDDGFNSARTHETRDYTVRAMMTTQWSDDDEEGGRER